MTRYEVDVVEMVSPGLSVSALVGCPSKQQAHTAVGVSESAGWLQERGARNIHGLDRGAWSRACAEARTSDH